MAKNAKKDPFALLDAETEEEPDDESEDLAKGKEKQEYYIQLHKPLTEKQIDQLLEFIKKIHKVIFGENSQKLRNAKEGDVNYYIVDERRNTSEMKNVFFVGESEIISDMMISGIEHTVCLFIRLIFYLWFDKYNEEKKFKKVANSC